MSGWEAEVAKASTEDLRAAFALLANEKFSFASADAKAKYDAILRVLEAELESRDE